MFTLQSLKLPLFKKATLYQRKTPVHYPIRKLYVKPGKVGKYHHMYFVLSEKKKTNTK